MLIRKGPEQIGNHGAASLIIDWDDLLHYRGYLRANERNEKAVGQLLRGLGWMLTVGALIVIVIFGQFSVDKILIPVSIFPLVFWIGLALIIYAAYLLRDRAVFSFALEPRGIQETLRLVERGKLAKIELDSLLNYQLWNKIDDIYHTDDRDFAWLLMLEVLGDAGVGRLTSRLGIDVSALRERLNLKLKGADMSFDNNYRGLFLSAFNMAVQLEMDEVSLMTMFLVFAQTVWSQTLTEMGITKQELEGMQIWLRNEHRKLNYLKIWQQMSILKPKGTVNRAYTSVYAPTLEEFGEDYTHKAAQGRFELSIGRDNEMLELVKILQKQNGAAVVLVGEPGVGKSQFLKHLGVRMVVEDVPKALKDQRLVAFDFNRAFTQNQSFETFKVTLEQVLNEVAASRDIVLILEDMDQLLNIRTDLQAEVVNLLSSAIDRYKLRVVGTASNDGYNRFIKPLRGLSSLFQPIYLNEPQPLIALQVLIDEADRLERKYGIKIQVPALKQIVALAPKFAYERVMPDKAIDLLEESLLDARDQGAAYLTSDIVNRVVSRKVGVTVGAISQAESEVLLNLERKMHERVVGQDLAIRAIAAALRRSRAGLAPGKRPIASFLFFGPTGVGKTEVAKTLAATYYGDEKMMTRFDMSEFQEEKNLERLIGFTENGKFIGGYLTEAVRAKPYSLLLIDEIDKANPKVLDLFLQILDEGFITDGSGRKVDFSNTIIIATSNAGSRQIAELIGEGMKYDDVYTQVLPVLRQVFRIEFLNRFDKVIMFKPLLPLEVENIAGHMLEEINKNLMEKGYRIEYTDKVLAELVQGGYNPMYGAREIRRVIQEKIEDVVAEGIVKGELTAGKTLRFSELDNYSID
jgi:ATP-dependent Clp protease ATP-binding subunit ClpC